MSSVRFYLFRAAGAAAISLAVAAPAALASPPGTSAPARPAASERPAKANPSPKDKVQLDHSGRRQVGKASFYAPKFHGRTMADGTPMDPEDDNAASRTLPLGTTARVTNLENGQSAVVTIQDRGPYIAGRIVDLSPATAEEIGLTPKEGLAPVEVEPIEVPLPDGGVKIGAGG